MFAIGVVVWLTAFVNIFNFMDGINGISSSLDRGCGRDWPRSARTPATTSCAMAD